MPEETVKTTCPCCGEQTFKLPAKVPQDKLDHYISCMLTGEPYTETYSLFGGRIKLTCRELPQMIVDKMNRLFTVKPKDESSIWGDFIQRLYTLLPVQKIVYENSKEGSTFLLKELTEPILDLASKHVDDQEWLKDKYELLNDPSKVSAIPRKILDKTVVTHLEQLDIFINSGFSPDFYEGIAQGS